MSNADPNRHSPAPGNESTFDSAEHEGRSREDMLDSLLEETRQIMDDKSYHTMLTDYVREHRLSSQYDFDNLTELVRCVLNRTRIDQLPIDKEETIAWVANCFYEDPLANERVESLWQSIVNRIQGAT